MDFNWVPWAFGILVPLIYLFGMYSAYHAIMHSLSAQGSTAWVISLLTIPFIAIPIYWTFGRVKYSYYQKSLEDFDKEFKELYGEEYDNLQKSCAFDKSVSKNKFDENVLNALENLSDTPFTCGNEIELLINGEDTFDAIFKAIDNAKDYVLVQYYIIRDDKIGTALKERLLAAAKRDVKIMLLYDLLGCISLDDDYLEELKSAGVEVSRFSGNSGWFNRLRLNFRNHRKIVVIDGKVGFIGGLNVGDEYMGRDKKLGFWRDTHLKIAGPVVQSLQLTVMRDWYFGIKALPELNWHPETKEADQCAVISATGPNDPLETCGLLFAQCIESAESRIWIASPYFIPDDRVLAALQLALLRGVEVRIMMPRKSDSFLFKYVPYAYFRDIESIGAEIYLYEKGFMHQKILLIDDKYSAIGTANMDNRSFRLNFEIVAVIKDRTLCQETAQMLEDDFSNASRLTGEKLDNPSWLFNFATHVTKLLAPIL